MGCITYGCHLYQESKKQNKGCLEIMENDYKNCCKGPIRYDPEELKYFSMGKCFMFGQEDYYKKLYNNKDHNMEFLKQLYEENEKLKVKMNDILTALFLVPRKTNPKVIIGTGNSCNNDCYLYNVDLTTKCPKCDGKVDEDFENDYTVEHKWVESKNAYVDVKKYNEKKICTGFRWNNNVSDCDVTLEGMFKYFDKKDPEKKTHYSIVVEDQTTKEKKTEEYDVENHYMMLNGERFDFPLGLTMKQFFFINNKFFFPKGNIISVENPTNFFQLAYRYRTPFWYEEQIGREELGQSFGYYGYAWIHMVNIYTCNSCGYKFHIIKTSPFVFRDKSKDPK